MNDIIETILVRSTQTIGRDYTAEEEAFIRSSSVRLRSGDFEVLDAIGPSEYIPTHIRSTGRSSSATPRLDGLRERMRRLVERS